jgi:hypothetical protein
MRNSVEFFLSAVYEAELERVVDSYSGRIYAWNA